MIQKRDWKEFQDSGMLWWINRMLHLFGWVICFDFDNGELKEVYPARCKFRGFSPTCETEGFKQVTEFMLKNANDLIKDCDDSTS